MDTTRRRAEFETLILQSLEAFGFQWDGPVLRQGSRSDAYTAALQRLQQRGELFFCACSRREIGEANTDASLGCVGGCAGRQAQLQPAQCSLRWQCAAASTLQFDDLWQGPCGYPQQSPDVVLRRRDGVHAYQLAVVVDDGEQGVTEVIRGADLLTSTPAQILLQRSLGLPQPRYGHLPLLLEADGRKLAKSRHAVAIDPLHAGEQLFQALQRLRQQPPAELSGAGVAELWPWALAHWNPGALAGLASISLPGSATGLPSGTP